MPREIPEEVDISAIFICLILRLISSCFMRRCAPVCHSAFHSPYIYFQYLLCVRHGARYCEYRDKEVCPWPLAESGIMDWTLDHARGFQLLLVSQW